MSRDPGHVLHYRGGVFEYRLVDFLVDVTNARAALIVGGSVSLVDVSDLKGLRVEDLAVDLKLFRDLLKLFFLIGHKQRSAPMARRTLVLRQISSNQTSSGLSSLKAAAATTPALKLARR